jgi:hypothetical protein
MSVRLLRTRRTITSALVALGIGLGGVAATAAPAEAASYVSGCFRSDRAGMSVASLPAQLQAYYNGSWYTISSQRLPQSQCVAWNIGSSHRAYYLRILVNYQAYGAWWYGQSPLWANPGHLAANLGTGTVTCHGCAF